MRQPQERNNHHPTSDPLRNVSSRSMPEDEIDFVGSDTFFVCFIDIVNSTKIVGGINSSYGIQKYYGIFLNTLARIARKYEAKIVKNAGDSIILYFPNTSNTRDSQGFQIAMACCMEIMHAHESMNLLGNYEGLPKIDYRISADYGKVEVAKSRSSTGYDLIGQTMNMCAKMNSMAKPQGFVIGSDLYEILRGLEAPIDSYYDFKLIGEYSAGLKYKYPVFEVQSKEGVIKYLQNINDVQYENQQIEGNRGSRHRIMIVDDEEDILMTYKAMLEDENIFEVETYRSSQAALQRLFTEGLTAYDLVITDVRMPPPNGLQFYNIVKSLNKQTQVLFITAYDIIEEVVSLLPDVKREHFLKKPINKQDLLREAKLLSCNER